MFDEVRKRAGIALIIVGAMLAFYPFVTYLYSWHAQMRLQRGFPTRSGAVRETGKEDADRQGTGVGEAWAILDIPSIGLSAAVVAGTSGNDLMKGPGWFRESAEPGKGNTVIAGHRTMYGGWFYRLQHLQPGDAVNLTYRDGVYHYRVERIWSAERDDREVVAPCGYPALTLVTCSPAGDRDRRLVVRARLTGRGTSEP